MSAALLDHLWQSSLFAACAWLFTLLLRTDGAHARYWIWFAASVKFLIPFSLLAMIGAQFGWHATQASATAPIASAVRQAAAPFIAPAAMIALPVQADIDLLRIVFLVWALGATTLAARWLVCWLRIAATVRSAVLTGLTDSVPVMTSPTLHEPGVVGIVRPVLLLPEGLASRLTPKQLQSILEHELCHVRRRDNLTAAIHMLVQSVFWFHPIIWWIGARLIEERERACDEAVVRSGNERQAYAEGILKVCQFHLASKLPCVAGVSGANLKLRMEIIMKHHVATELSSSKKLMLGIAALATVAVPVLVGLTTSTQARAQVEPAPVAIGQVGKIELLPGKRVKVSFKNVEVRSLLRALADAAHVNMLISDRVSGTVTLTLAESPWDQVVDIVLHAKGLVRHEKNGIIFVAPASEN